MSDASGNTTPESTQSQARTAYAVAVAEGEDSKGVLRPLMRTAHAVDIKVIGNLTEPTRQGTEYAGDNNQLNLDNNGYLQFSAPEFYYNTGDNYYLNQEMLPQPAQPRMSDASDNTTPESTQSQARTASAVAVAEGEDSKGPLRPMMRTAYAVDIKVIGNLMEPARQGTEYAFDDKCGLRYGELWNAIQQSTWDFKAWLFTTGIEHQPGPPRSEDEQDALSAACSRIHVECVPKANRHHMTVCFPQNQDMRMVESPLIVHICG